MTVPDKTERDNLEKQIISERWSGDQLQEHLNTTRKFEVLKDPSYIVPKLKVERGVVYTYKMVKQKNIQEFPDRLYVDHGFYNYKWVDYSPLRLNEGDIVETVKNDDGRYSLKRSEKSAKDIYTFKAVLVRYVDADTLWVLVDTGFDSWRLVELRFRGIDCPEISTPEGQKAKLLVESRLLPCEFIVIKTYWDDKYGRMLVDVFYKKGEKDPQKLADEGTFLNQELLDNRLAVVWKG